MKIEKSLIELIYIPTMDCNSNGVLLKKEGILDYFLCEDNFLLDHISTIRSILSRKLSDFYADVNKASDLFLIKYWLFMIEQYKLIEKSHTARLMGNILLVENGDKIEIVESFPTIQDKIKFILNR